LPTTAAAPYKGKIGFFAFDIETDQFTTEQKQPIGNNNNNGAYTTTMP
jgi:hypothetical protein